MIKLVVNKCITLNTSRQVVSSSIRNYCTFYNTTDNQLPYDTSPVKREKEDKNHVGRYLDTYNKHKRYVTFYDKDSAGTPGVWGLYPRIPNGVFVAPSASVVGNVNIGIGASIWYGAVVKADVNLIHIGSYSNVQDGTIIKEATRPLSLDHDGSTVIGHYTTIGHNCTLDACTIEDHCLIGMGSTLEAGSYVEANSIIGAHSILPKNTRVPTGQLWMGRPAKYVRDVTHEEIVDIHNQAAQYFVYSQQHNQELGLHNPSSVHIDAEAQGIQVGYSGEYFNTEEDRELVTQN